MPSRAAVDVASRRACASIVPVSTYPEPKTTAEAGGGREPGTAAVAGPVLTCAAAVRSRRPDSRRSVERPRRERLALAEATSRTRGDRLRAGGVAARSKTPTRREPAAAVRLATRRQRRRARGSTSCAFAAAYCSGPRRAAARRDRRPALPHARLRRRRRLRRRVERVVGSPVERRGLPFHGQSSIRAARAKSSSFTKSTPWTHRASCEENFPSEFPAAAPEIN